MPTTRTVSRRAWRVRRLGRPAPLRVAAERGRDRAAALVVLAAGCLLGGCDSGEEPPPLPSTNAPADATSDLFADPAVAGLGRNVAWYTAHGGRLPREPAQVREHVTVPGWSQVPQRTRDGRPVTYRPTGERTFEIVVGDASGPAAARTVIALTVPENVPTDMAPEVFDQWWGLEVSRQQLRELEERLKQLGG